MDASLTLSFLLILKFIFYTNHSFPSSFLPVPSRHFFSTHPIHSFLLPFRKGPMGVNKTWHLKLRQDQLSPLCVKAEQGMAS